MWDPGVCWVNGPELLCTQKIEAAYNPFTRGGGVNDITIRQPQFFKHVWSPFPLRAPHSIYLIREGTDQAGSWNSLPRLIEKENINFTRDLAQKKLTCLLKRDHFKRERSTFPAVTLGDSPGPLSPVDDDVLRRNKNGWLPKMKSKYVNLVAWNVHLTILHASGEYPTVTFTTQGTKPQMKNTDWSWLINDRLLIVSNYD